MLLEGVLREGERKNAPLIDRSEFRRGLGESGVDNRGGLVDEGSRGSGMRLRIIKINLERACVIERKPIYTLNCVSPPYFHSAPMLIWQALYSASVMIEEAFSFHHGSA